MYRPSPLANIIEQVVRKIAQRDGVSLEQAAEIFKQQVHRRATELLLQRQHERN